MSLVEAGANVVLHGRTTERVARLARETGQDVIACDLASPAGESALRARLQGWDGLDVLVLSCGMYQRSLDPRVLETQLSASLIAPYTALQVALPLVVAAKGQIVFINSTQALRASRDVGQYAATQHALRAIADSTREEVNALGVRVLTVFGGSTAGDRQRAICESDNVPYRPELLIQPADVAHVVFAMLTLPRTAEVTDLILRPMHSPPPRKIGL